MIRNSNTSPLMLVAIAITKVKIIDDTYIIDGIIRLFFFISFHWPAGVDRKQLPAMFRIWPMEYRMAKAATSKLENTNTKDTMKDSTLPVIEQASHPISLVL